MNPIQYRYGGDPQPVSQYGLGGLFKSIGRVARTALPIAASFIPGVGGIAAGVIGGLMNQKANNDAMKRQANSMQEAISQARGAAAGAAGPAGLTQAELTAGMDAHVNEMHKRQTTAVASDGALEGGMLAKGGFVPIGKGAVKFQGPSHEGGGIRISPDAEVEGGEVMVKLANGGFSTRGNKVVQNGRDYIFSNRIKMPGSNVSFSKGAERALKMGAGPEHLVRMAGAQEVASGRTKQYGWGGQLLSGAGKWLGNNAGNIAMLAPSLMNIGQGMFGSTQSPVMQQIQAEQIEDPNRADFGPVDRSGLKELRQGPGLRLDYSAAYDRNAAATRTASMGMGTAGRLAALAQGRAGNLELAADQAQRQDVFNAQNRAQVMSQRASMASGYDMADASNRGQFASLLQQSRQFNAGQRSGANQFNAQADFQNQQGRMQAEAAKQNMLNAGLAGIGQFANAVQDRSAQRQGNQANAMLAYSSASAATQARMAPWMNQQFGTNFGYQSPASKPKPAPKYIPGYSKPPVTPK